MERLEEAYREALLQRHEHRGRATTGSTRGPCGTLSATTSLVLHETDGQVRTPEIRGVDEIHLSGPRCVLTNIGQRTLFGCLKARTKETLVPYSEALPDKGNVKVIVADMYRPYHQMADRFFSERPVVVDKFHIVRNGERGPRQRPQEGRPEPDTRGADRISRRQSTRVRRPSRPDDMSARSFATADAFDPDLAVVEYGPDIDTIVEMLRRENETGHPIA